MYWNNDYRYRVKKGDAQVTVHELASETHITGTTEYFNGNILIGPIADETASDMHYYQLKLVHDKNAKYDVTKSSPNGYYHPDGVAGEIVSLLSLFFRARFYHLSSTYGNLTKMSIQGRNRNEILRVNAPKHIDEAVLGRNKRNFVDFIPYLETIESIPEAHHRAIISAATNYNLALREIGIDHEMVFVRLVSAIEAFSSDFVLRPKNNPLKSEDINNLLKTVNKETKGEILAALETRKSRLKFTRFLEQYSSGYFKGGNYKAKHTKITKPQLETLSKAVYSARSKYLHSGERMYLSQAFPGMKFDTDPSVGMTIGMREFKEKDKLPNIEFFEGLVRHCILNKIDELATTSRPTPKRRKSKL